MKIKLVKKSELPPLTLEQAEKLWKVLQENVSRAWEKYDAEQCCADDSFFGVMSITSSTLTALYDGSDVLQYGDYEEEEEDDE